MKNLHKFLICFLICLVIYLLICFFWLDRKTAEHIQQVRTVERLRFDSFRQQHEVLIDEYQKTIDSLQDIKTKNKTVFIEKIKYLKPEDTCQRWKAEAEYYAFDNQILTEENSYLRKTISGCDSQFIALADYCEKNDSIKTGEINRLISDSVNMQNIITAGERRIRQKENVIVRMTAVMIAEAVCIVLLLR